LHCTEEVGLVTGPTPRRKIRVICLTALLALAVTRAALAQVTPAAGYVPPDDTQSVKIGAVVYADFTVTASPKSLDAAGNVFTPSAFNVGRTYLNVTGNLSHRVSFRITPDIARETNATPALSGSLIFRMKYGFMQYTLDDWTGNWKQTWVRLGIQQTPVVDFEEGIYRYRFQGTVFAEREGFLSSSDAGASFHTNLPNNLGDVHVGVYNGEFYSKLETNSQKAYQVRATLRPMGRSSMLAARGLRLTGFWNGDHIVHDGKRTRGMFQTTFEHKYVNTGFDYLRTADMALPATSPVCVNAAIPSVNCGVQTNANGWSYWATPFFKEKGNGFELLIRLDHLKPNATATAINATTTSIRNRGIYGISYWFPHPGGAATGAILLDYERVSFPGAPLQQRYAVHGLINF
jgi:hypothetical protein